MLGNNSVIGESTQKTRKLRPFWSKIASTGRNLVNLDYDYICLISPVRRSCILLIYCVANKSRALESTTSFHKMEINHRNLSHFK